MKNRIINGDMRVDQRNEGGLVTVNSNAIFRSVDKFWGFGGAAAGVFTLQRLSATPPASFTNYLRATVTTADAAPVSGASYLIVSIIEGFLLEDTNFGQATALNVSISFWVRTSITGTFSVAILNGTVNRAYISPFVVGSSNTWTKITISIPGDVTGTWIFGNGAGIRLEFDLGSGSGQTSAANVWTAGNVSRATGSTSVIAVNGATLDLTGVQLEVSTSATSFDYLLYPVQLECCQRYYVKSFAQGTVPAAAVGVNTGESRGIISLVALANDHIQNVEFPVTMRAAPTPAFYNPVTAANFQARDFTAGDCTATNSANVTDRALNVDFTGNASSAVGNQTGIHWTADADL